MDVKLRCWLMLIVNSADLVETMENHYFTSVVLWKLRLLQDASYCFILQGCPCSFLIFCALPHFLCLDIVKVTLTTGWLAPVVVTPMTTTFTEVSAACTLNLVVTQRDLAGLSHVVFAELFPYHSYFNRFSLSDFESLFASMLAFTCVGWNCTRDITCHPPPFPFISWTLIRNHKHKKHLE